jgi:hypothetical protein
MTIRPLASRGLSAGLDSPDFLLYVTAGQCPWLVKRQDKHDVDLKVLVQRPRTLFVVQIVHQYRERTLGWSAACITSGDSGRSMVDEVLPLL